MKRNINFQLYNSDDLNFETSALVRKARMDRDLSLQQVGLKVGMKQQQLHEIERGLKPLPPERVPPLARALRIQMDQLIDAAVRDFKRKYERRASAPEETTQDDIVA